MAIKKVLLQKKLSGTIYDIFPKTSADLVTYETGTVAETLAKFAEDIAKRITPAEVDTKVANESKALYNKIMGITGAEGDTVQAAYDTLKEVANWISDHQDIANGFVTDINALKEAVGDESSGLIKGLADVVAAQQQDNTDIETLNTAIDNLKTVVGDSGKGLVKAVADNTASINTLKQTVGDSTSCLVK